MPKDPTTSPADSLPVDPAALEAELRAKIESELRAEYEGKLRAAGATVPASPADGKPAVYFHRQGRELIGVPVIAAGGTLYHPESAVVLVTGAKPSDAPEDGRYVLKA